MRPYGEKVHACCEGDNVGEADDALTLEELSGYHGMTGKLPLVYNPSGDEGETGEHGAKNVARCPRMGVATGLERDEAVHSQSGVHVSKGVSDLQQCQASDGQDATNEVNPL
jgi:hypothetical protein